MTPDKVRQVRQHVFFDQHRLDRGLDRFDPDPDTADAWRRLQRGEPLPEDLDLLRHEHAESRHERLHGSTYREAHQAAIDEGATWQAPPWKP